jgi:hypothetical protein
MKPRIVEYPNDQTEVTESRLNRLTRYELDGFRWNVFLTDSFWYLFVLGVLLGLAAFGAHVSGIFDSIGVVYGK